MKSCVFVLLFAPRGGSLCESPRGAVVTSYRGKRLFVLLLGAPLTFCFCFDAGKCFCCACVGFPPCVLCSLGLLGFPLLLLFCFLLPEFIYGDGLFAFLFCFLPFIFCWFGRFGACAVCFFAWRFKSVVYALGAIALLALFLLFK